MGMMHGISDVVHMLEQVLAAIEKQNELLARVAELDPRRSDG